MPLVITRGSLQAQKIPDELMQQMQTQLPECRTISFRHRTVRAYFLSKADERVPGKTFVYVYAIAVEPDMTHFRVRLITRIAQSIAQWATASCPGWSLLDIVIRQIDPGFYMAIDSRNHSRKAIADGVRR